MRPGWAQIQKIHKNKWISNHPQRLRDPCESLRRGSGRGQGWVGEGSRRGRGTSVGEELPLELPIREKKNKNTRKNKNTKNIKNIKNTKNNTLWRQLLIHKKKDKKMRKHKKRNTCKKSNKIKKNYFVGIF